VAAVTDITEGHAESTDMVQKSRILRIIEFMKFCPNTLLLLPQVRDHNLFLLVVVVVFVGLVVVLIVTVVVVIEE
jgi:hypothetical protein